MKRLLFILLLMSTLLVLLPACTQLAAAEPSESGAIEIVMTDYKFEPDVVRLKAGQTVTIRLRNQGGKMHELMIGRDIEIHGNFTEGFTQDFFAGIVPEVSGPGMVMGLPGMEMEMGDMEMGEDEHEEGDSMEMGEDEHEEEEMAMGEDEHDEDSMAMDESEMGDDHEETAMEMDDDHSEEEMAMDEQEGGAGMEMEGMEMETDEHEEEEATAAGEFGAFQLPEMDAHSGVMIMVDPSTTATTAGEVTTITFTVPADKVGTWQFGCFQERGQHYDDGMDGTLIVEP